MPPYTNTIARYFGADSEHPQYPVSEETFQRRVLVHDVLNAAYRDLEKLLPAGPETTTCFRKLLEAKDCALRAVAAE